MRKEVLILLFLIILSTSVYPFLVPEGKSPRSTAVPSYDYTCNELGFFDYNGVGYIDPDTSMTACITGVCDEPVSCPAGSVGCIVQGVCADGTLPLPPTPNAAWLYSFIGSYPGNPVCGFYDTIVGTTPGNLKRYGWVDSGESFSHGGYTNTFTLSCCGDDSINVLGTGIYQEAYFPAQSPSDLTGACCQTPAVSSPELVSNGICCGVHANSSVLFLNPDNNYYACNNLENKPQGVYMCPPRGKVVVDAPRDPPGMVCGEGTESCYIGAGNCCGDDNNEFSRGCKIDPGNGDGSFCPTGAWSCSPNRACINSTDVYDLDETAEIQGDLSPDKEVCFDSGISNEQYLWSDADQYPNTCSAVGGTWIDGEFDYSTSKCQGDPNGRWGDPLNPSCDDSFAFDIDFCCGDDPKEVLKSSGGVDRCCRDIDADWDTCTMPTASSLRVDISYPSNGATIGQNVNVRANYSSLGLINPFFTCAVNLGTSPAPYNGAEINGWTDSTSSIDNRSGNINFFLTGLTPSQTYTITVGCYDVGEDVYGFDSVTVQTINNPCGDHFIDTISGEQCDFDSFGVPIYDAAYDTCEELIGVSGAQGSPTCNPSTCQVDSSACTACGNDEYDAGFNEDCELPEVSDYSSLKPGHSCQPNLGGQNFLRCTSTCQCAYSNNPFDGYSIRFSGTCQGADNLGIGTAQDTLVTYLPDGTNTSTVLPLRNCVNLEVDEPFIGPFSVLLLVVIITLFYLNRKKLNL